MFFDLFHNHGCEPTKLVASHIFSRSLAGCLPPLFSRIRFLSFFWWNHLTIYTSKHLSTHCQRRDPKLRCWKCKLWQQSKGTNSDHWLSHGCGGVDGRTFLVGTVGWGLHLTKKELDEYGTAMWKLTISWKTWILGSCGILSNRTLSSWLNNQFRGRHNSRISVPRLDSPPKSRHVPGFKDSYHMAIFSRPWPLWKCSRFWCRIICVWNVLWSAPPRPLGGDDPFRDGLKHIGNKESSVLLFSEIFISNGPT